MRRIRRPKLGTSMEVTTHSPLRCCRKKQADQQIPKHNYLMAKTTLRAFEMRAQAELHRATKDRMGELQKANAVLVRSIHSLCSTAQIFCAYIRYQQEETR